MRELFKRLFALPVDGCEFAIQLFALAGITLVTCELLFFLTLMVRRLLS